MRLAVLLLAAAVAAPSYADYSADPRAAELLQRLQREAKFTPSELATVRDALTKAERIPALIEAEQTSAERTETWTTYSAKRVDAPRIARGADFIRENRTPLAEAEAQYGVPPSVIAGVLGLETNFGRTTGSARVLDALATQGFEHPTRSRFFFEELVQYFVFCRDFGYDPTALKGSYAGAMGWAQFMPSNYRRLAVDFDGDGKRDLWQPVDAIGSIAHYFTSYDPARAWHRGEPLVVPAKLSKALPAKFPLNAKKAGYTVAKLRKLGVEPAVQLPDNLAAGLIALTLDDGVEYWIGLHNFYSVMSYNPRVYYAMTVTRLSQEMARLDAAQSGGE